MGVGVVFLVILIASTGGPAARLGSAVIGALAAPWIFEFPFDLVVMTRTYPIPPDPAGYRALFFLPLFAIALSTLALLTLSPMVRLSRATFWSFALMLAVFAVWALSGFGYPSAPVPITLNVVSKILAFVTALTLFLPLRDQASVREPAGRRSPGAQVGGSGPGGRLPRGRRPGVRQHGPSAALERRVPGYPALRTLAGIRRGWAPRGRWPGQRRNHDLNEEAAPVPVALGVVGSTRVHGNGCAGGRSAARGLGSQLSDGDGAPVQLRSQRPGGEPDRVRDVR